MTLPEITTPAALASHMGWSERLVREKAKALVAGRRLRGSCKTADKDLAARAAAQIEAREWKCNLDGPAAVLTFAQASMLYRADGRSTRFLDKIEDYWKDTLVKDIKTVARLGGWKSAKYLLDTYAHAIDDITLNDAVFDTSLTQPVVRKSKTKAKTGSY